MKRKRQKRTGDPMLSRWLREYCPRGCGCRLRTDGKLIWCSYIHCNFSQEVHDGGFGRFTQRVDAQSGGMPV